MPLFKHRFSLWVLLICSLKEMNFLCAQSVSEKKSYGTKRSVLSDFFSRTFCSRRKFIYSFWNAVLSSLSSHLFPVWLIENAWCMTVLPLCRGMFTCVNTVGTWRAFDKSSCFSSLKNIYLRLSYREVCWNDRPILLKKRRGEGANH